MNIDQIKKIIRAEWEVDTGALYKLRQGQFEPVGLSRVVEAVEAIQVAGDVLDRELVSLIWFLPLFTEWQRERVEKRAGIDMSLFSAFEGRIFTAVEKVLGLP